MHVAFSVSYCYTVCYSMPLLCVFTVFYCYIVFDSIPLLCIFTVYGYTVFDSIPLSCIFTELLLLVHVTVCRCYVLLLFTVVLHCVPVCYICYLSLHLVTLIDKISQY